MPGVPTLTAFAGQVPPWSLVSLDANMTNISALLKDVGNYNPYVLDAGAVNAYVITYGAGITFALATNPAIVFKAVNANTGASTMNANATGVKSIVNVDGTALVANQIKAGGVYKIVYDGTNYVLLNPTQGIIGANAVVTGTITVDTGATGDQAIIGHTIKGHLTENGSAFGLLHASTIATGTGVSFTATTAVLQIAGSAILTGTGSGVSTPGTFLSTGLATFTAGFTVSGASTMQIGTGYIRQDNFRVNDAADSINIFRADNSGNFNLYQIGTTASAANAFIDNASSNNVRRVTSSLEYKSNLRPISPAALEAVLGLSGIKYASLAKGDNPDWSWYGYGAEDVAPVDPRLVHWTRRVTGYEDETYEVEEQVHEDQPVESVELRDGKHVLVTKMVSTPVFDVVPLFDEAGEPIMVVLEGGREAVLDAEGAELEPAKEAVLGQRTARIPRTQMVEKTRKVPVYGPMVPDGVMYERVAVLDHEWVKRLVKAARAKKWEL